MAGTPAEGSPAAPQGQSAERIVSDADKALAKEWDKRIKAALKRVEAPFAKFEENRQLLAGKVKKGAQETVRANLHFANMAAMLPQVYAKDPEFAAKPTNAVGKDQLQAVKRFAATAEFMLRKIVVKDGKLKSRSKKLLRSGFATSVGWLKVSFQEKKGQDPLILNRIKDTQDNIDHVKRLLDETNDPKLAGQHQTKMAELQQALEGLQTPQEVTLAKGIALDFVMSEDILIIDPAIRSVDDYPRAAAIGHRVWMTPDQYRENFGYECKGGKNYTEQNGAMASTDSTNGKSTLLCVWEIWSQADNRIFYVCDGEEGFCKEPMSPEWTGKRWYPFFLLAWNEIDGGFYPLSDVELTDKLVKEYNENREDFVRDRRECLPITVIRKGGSLTPDDVKNISNAQGGDKVMVEGVGGQPLTNDLFIGSMGTLNPLNYNTDATRYDMERILGGSDTTTGSITKAKTLGEAQMLSAAVQSRNGDRRDTLEDLFNEMGPYCVEVMLRKYNEAEVQKIAGPDAAWPSMGIEDIFDLVSIEVRGGSTGKPDKALEQETWTKLLPIVNEAVAKVAELRQQGQEPLAQAVIELTRETLRRFDERIDIEQFLPKMPEGEDDPMLLKQQVIQQQQQLEEMQAKLKEAVEKVEKGFIGAAAQIAVSAQPAAASVAFTNLLGMPLPDVQGILAATTPEQPPEGEKQVSQPEGAMPPQDDEIPPQPPEQALPQQ